MATDIDLIISRGVASENLAARLRTFVATVDACAAWWKHHPEIRIHDLCNIPLVFYLAGRPEPVTLTNLAHLYVDINRMATEEKLTLNNAYIEKGFIIVARYIYKRAYLCSSKKQLAPLVNNEAEKQGEK